MAATRRTPPDGESYDLASGFQTLIRTNEGIADAIDQMRQTLVASMDMRSKFDTDPRTAQAARSTRDAAQSNNDPTAGQTKGGQANGPAQTFESLRAQAAQALFNRVQPSSGPLGPGGRLGGPARDAETGTGGGWGSRFAPPGNRGSGGSGGGTGGAGGSGGHGGGSGGANSPGGAPDAGAGGSGGHGGGGSVGGGMVNGILSHVPYMNEVNKVMSEWHSQVDKTNYYRNVEGGTVGSALGERAREEGFRFKTWGRLSEDESRAAFKGVTRIGYTDRSDQRLGTTRDEALSYVTDAKTSRGQSVEESLGQIQVASRSLSIDLGNLNKSMEAVSDSAGKAGVNTEMARQQMTNLMNMGIQRGQGAGAVGFAQAIAQTNVSYGRDYASQVDSSQMYSVSQSYRAAAMSNMNPGELTNLQRHDPAAALKAYDKLNSLAMDSGGITPQMKEWIKAKVKAVGGADVLRNQPEIADQIGGEFLDQFLPQMGTPEAFTTVVGQLSGQNFAGNVEMAARWLVNNIGGNTIAATAAKNQMQVAKTDLSGKMKDGKKNAGVSTSLDKFKELSTTGGFMGMGKDRSTAADNYITAATKSKHRDPVIEALLQADGLKGTDGNKAQVEVQTKTGARVVPLADAIKQFPEEVAAGKVRFMNGSTAGKTVQDLTGGEVDTTRNWRSEVLKTTKSGVSSQEWNKTHKAPEQGGGKIQIGLSPDASRLVTAMSVGGTLGTAASQGAPPIPSNTGSRSGSGVLFGP